MAGPKAGVVPGARPWMTARPVGDRQPGSDGSKKLTIGDGLTAEQRSEAQKLMNLRGAEFDTAYVKAMVDGHEKAIDAFSEQAGQGRSEIDRWAADKLPVLRQHLSHAESLEKSEQVSSNP